MALIVARAMGVHFVSFSAVLSGVKDIRAVIEDAKQQLKYYGKRTILFVDEIHRFNRLSRMPFLHHVEDGTITLDWRYYGRTLHLRSMHPSLTLQGVGSGTTLC